MIVGGLPEAVANYAKYKDFVKLNDVFNSLLSGYRDDGLYLCSRNYILLIVLNKMDEKLAFISYD